MIPIDIVDRVLGVLHSDKDYATLETCSLVFPQFVDRHLYSQITLWLEIAGGRPVAQRALIKPNFYPTPKPTYYVVDPTKFSRMLIDYPRVANYVRVVQIVIEVTTELALSITHISQQVGDQLSSTSSILATLPHPEMIMVNVQGRQVPWHMLGSKFCSAFRNSIRLPSIISITISNTYGFSLGHFDNCKNLKDLCLGGRCIFGETVSTSPYPRLRSLHIDDHRNLVRVVSWMKSNTLHTLSLCLSGSSLPEFQTLIKACSTTIVHLDIDLNFSSLSSDLPIVFPNLQLPFLDHLTFRSQARDGRAFRDVSIPFLGSIESLSSSSSIRLTLHLLLLNDNEVDWSLIIPVLILPIFRHPIELYFARYDDGEFDPLSSVENNPDVKRLQENGTLVAFLE